MDYFRQLVKEIGDVNTNIMDDEMNTSEFTGTIDTGSYIFNALLSTSIYGGMPNNKCLGLAGESATGKTFFALGLVNAFLKQHENGGILFYDTETAVTKAMMEKRGIDPKRVIISEQTTIEEFRTHLMRTVDKYLASYEKTRPPMFAVLDSLGMLSTNKEVKDILEDTEKRDMTRAPLIRGLFRAARLRLARARIPMVITNHTYSSMDQYKPMEIAGGGGFKYAADQIIVLSKRKEKVGDEVVGNIIHCKSFKNRIAKENVVVDVKLSYATGLDRYYGLLDLAEKYEIFKKVSTKYELPDGRKVFGKQINEQPEKVYTKEILDQLDEAAKKEFSYGEGETVREDESTEDSEV